MNLIAMGGWGCRVNPLQEVMFLLMYIIIFSRDEIRRVAVHNLFLGFILLLCSHTFLLHCWSNCWAELLGFADCTFYEVITLFSL